MTLWEMLDCTLYYGKVFICTRNACGQCILIFKGCVQDARGNTEGVWDYLPKEVDQWICGNGATLIYVKHYDYENPLENSYTNSDKWTSTRRPFLYSNEVERAFADWSDNE